MNEFENSLAIQQSANRGGWRGLIRRLKPSKTSRAALSQLAERQLLDGARADMEFDQLQRGVELFEGKARARNYLADADDRFHSLALYQRVVRQDQLRKTTVNASDQGLRRIREFEARHKDDPAAGVIADAMRQQLIDELKNQEIS